jgi:hypothetical protein
MFMFMLILCARYEHEHSDINVDMSNLYVQYMNMVAFID